MGAPPRGGPAAPGAAPGAGLAPGARVLVAGPPPSAPADPLPHVGDLTRAAATAVDGGIRLRWSGS